MQVDQGDVAWGSSLTRGQSEESERSQAWAASAREDRPGRERRVGEPERVCCEERECSAVRGMSGVRRTCVRLGGACEALGGVEGGRRGKL